MDWDGRTVNTLHWGIGMASKHRAMVGARMDTACHTLPLRSGAVV